MLLIIVIFVFVVIFIIYFLTFTQKEDYNVQEIPNFLTHEECNHIIKLSEPKLFKSCVYKESNEDDAGSTDVIDTTHRVSEQCWLDHSHILSHKVAELTNTLVDQQEQLQVVKYNKGGFFNPHYDACQGDENFCKRMNISGPRYITVLIYLNDDYEGGETVFPKINKVVKPEKGKAIVFYNTDKNSGHVLQKSLHGGNPVLSGNKWICNIWIKNQN